MKGLRLIDALVVLRVKIMAILIDKIKLISKSKSTSMVSKQIKPFLILLLKPKVIINIVINIHSPTKNA